MNRTYHPRNVPIEGYAPREHPLYVCWASMLARCTNPKQPGYENYGGRGITVDRRWHHFENFVVDMGARPRGDFTIERKKNNLGYCKSNCTWASRSDQCVNRRKFKNNTSGYTGVVEIDGRFEGRFDFEYVRYHVGRFNSVQKAAQARRKFVDLFFKDREAAIESLPAPGETLWFTSTSGVRGVTPHKDGGFIARATVDGERHYLGYFQSIEEATNVRQQFIEARNRGS